jgi:GDP-L-fucose synthase
MNLLVTGCSGLLGEEILRNCSESIGINSQDCNLLSPYPRDSFFYQIEKASESRGNQIDTVIHCAAKVGGVKANTDYVADFFDDNMKMNMNVMKACKEAGLKLVSVLSTCVYPDSFYVRYPLTEDQLHMGPPHPSNFGYAYAKRMLEVQSRAYRQQFGCNFISVIPNNLYGLNDNYDLSSGHVIPALIRKFHEAKIRGEKEVVVWGTGRPVREFTFARDAARIILWLAENYDGPEPVNIGNHQEVSIGNLALIIAELIGFEGNIVFDSSKPDGQYQKPSSNERLRSLGWKGEYTSLYDGLKETINSFILRYPNVRGVKIGS